MLNKLSSLVLVSALLCTLGGTSAFANNLTEPDGKSRAVETPVTSGTAAKTEAKSSEALKADMLKLVADSKAGKGKLSAPAQFKPARGNNLSKGQKIAIVAGIAAVVVLVIVVVHTRNHLFDDFNLSNNR